MNVFVPQWTPTQIDLFYRITTDTEMEPGGHWAFSVGDPESWRYEQQLVVPNGTLLDLGVGHGRSCMSYALKGMNVVAYDHDTEKLDFLDELIKDYDLPIQINYGDIRYVDFGTNVYDTILCVDLFVHFPSRYAVFNLLDRALTALKPGGHLFVRAVGKEDFRYGLYQRDPHVEVVNEDVMRAYCSCSGTYMIENHLFLGQTDLLQYFLLQGLEIVYSRIMPHIGAKNVMFGEDWHSSSGGKDRHGAITHIVKRP